MVYIVIPVHNRKEATLRVLATLHSQSFKDARIIVVDDGSTDGTEECVRQMFPQVIVLHGDGNLWWTGATNLGAQYALERANDGDFILTQNNDTVVDSSYLLNLLAVVKANPKSLIGSIAVSDQDRATVLDGGVRINWVSAKFTRLAVGRRLEDLEERTQVEVDALPGRGTLIPIEVFKKVGLYNFARLPHYGADYEFSIRARNAGYRLLVDYNSVVCANKTSTGVNNEFAALPLGKLAQAFFTRRSAYQISTRWNFARLAAPRSLRLWFFLLDFSRVIIGRIRNQSSRGRKD